MTEIGIGILFAAWFVTVYLLIAKLVGPRRKQRLALWRHWSTAQFDGAQLAGGRKPQLFLTTEALSRHHTEGQGRKPAGRKSAGADRERG
ncbi:MAG TPA: hypothetical protein VGC64_00660 [Pyrinomonadaceae bacterium]|jgi:hypothetical protein